MPMVDVTLPNLAAQAIQKRWASITYCATCHGDNAAGRDGIGPPLVHLLYQSGHHGGAALLLSARGAELGDCEALAGADWGTLIGGGWLRCA